MRVAQRGLTVAHITLIHPQQIACEQRSFVAPGPRPDLRAYGQMSGRAVMPAPVPRDWDAQKDTSD